MRLQAQCTWSAQSKGKDSNKISTGPLQAECTIQMFVNLFSRMSFGIYKIPEFGNLVELQCIFYARRQPYYANFADYTGCVYNNIIWLLINKHLYLRSKRLTNWGNRPAQQYCTY